MSDPGFTTAAEGLAVGIAFHRSGEITAAEHSYLGVLALDPKQSEALKLLSVISLERGDLARARSYVEAALAEQPVSGEYLHLLGRVLLQQGEFDAAAQALSGALRHNAPGRIDALRDLAACHARRRAWGDSLTAARAVLQEVPNDIEAQRIAGFACFWLGLDTDGIAHFDRFLAVDSSHAGVWHASGVMLLRLGQAPAAYQRSVKACELAPDNAEYAYQRHVCAASAVPDWHFNMLHDSARNAAFVDAIAARVKPEHLVLEIGTGSGLLAMLAARGSGSTEGARRVVTCEGNPLLAQAAARIVEHNGLSKHVSVIAKRSSELTIGQDLPELADVLICEVFSVQVISEGVLPTVEDAKARLLKPGGIVIPAAAAARGALVASDALGRRARVGDIHGFDLSALNEFAPLVQYLTPEAGLTLLSEAVDLLAFDFMANSRFPAQKHMLEVPVHTVGTCQGVLQWLRLDLTEGVSFENRPDAASPGTSRHWAPVFYPFREPVALHVGQVVTLRVSHNRAGVRVELSGVSGA